jgi:hypothetical protein
MEPEIAGLLSPGRRDVFLHGFLGIWCPAARALASNNPKETQMDGDRMQVPAIESQRPTLVPPAPYSIPPLGYDVRPPKKGWDKERIGVVAFVMGTLVGALLIGAIRTAWLERLTGVTPPHVVQAAAALRPPVPRCLLPL